MQQRLEDQDPLLRELLRWTRIGAIHLREVLAVELKTDEERLAYELSNGERSSRDIEQETGIDHSTISRLWKKWSEIGIVEPSERFQGRMRRLCSLRELALRVPPTPRRSPIAQGEPQEAAAEDAHE